MNNNTGLEWAPRLRLRERDRLPRVAIVSLLLSAGIVTSRLLAVFSIETLGWLIVLALCFHVPYLIHEYLTDMELTRLPLVATPLLAIVVLGLQKLCDACPDGLMLTFLAAVFAALALSMHVVAEHCRVAIRRCELLEVPLKRELAAGPNSERLCAGLIAGVFSAAVVYLVYFRLFATETAPYTGLLACWNWAIPIIAVKLTARREWCWFVEAFEHWFSYEPRGSRPDLLRIEPPFGSRRSRRLALYGVVALLAAAVACCCPMPGRSRFPLLAVFNFVADHEGARAEGYLTLLRTASVFLAAVPLPLAMLVASYCSVSMFATGRHIGFLEDLPKYYQERGW